MLGAEEGEVLGTEEVEKELKEEEKWYERVEKKRRYHQQKEAKRINISK